MHSEYGVNIGDMSVWWWAFRFVVVCGLIWFVFTRVVHTRRLDDSPEAVLKRRYAQGELNQQEYERHLNDLRK